MKSLVATALLLCSDATRQALEEDSSLMQGLSGSAIVRNAHLVAPDTQDTAKDARKDATTKLMETATNMMKNGVTPDVVEFIESTITEVNDNVLGAIVDEHNRDQQEIDTLLSRFEDSIGVMRACTDSINAEQVERAESSLAHKTCRSGEALDCARSRKCEEELEQLWAVVKMQEEEMRRLHAAIHGEWCIGPVPDHPGLDDPFSWVPVTEKEGPETSQTQGGYPTVDYTQDVIAFRTFSVDYFGYYMAQKPRVELAWNNYNAKLLECAELEAILESKVEQCDSLQDTLWTQACNHASSSRACAAEYGEQYQLDLESYTNALEVFPQKEEDRKREWTTLHIVTCLLETVYTHVIHSIDSGEPCPTEESHPEQTEGEINACHVVSESLTANLTLIYGDPPNPPDLPPLVAPPCTAQYLWDEHGAFPSAVQVSHTQAIEDEGLGAFFTTLSASGWAGCAAPRACTSCPGELGQITNEDYTGVESCGSWHNHLHPGQMDAEHFKCLSGDQCIQTSGRCNGHNNCADGSDESSCDTSWGDAAVMHREECQDPFVSDVQFRCLDGACIPIEGKCNGVNNCADGSDESCDAAGLGGLTVEPATGLEATIEAPVLQSQVFYDRDYTFDSLGSFAGHKYVKMSNDDKHIRHSHVQMKLRLTQPTTVYVVKLDDHTLPWLETDGWAISSLEGVTYHGVRQTKHTEWRLANAEHPLNQLTEDSYTLGVVWQKTFTAGTVEMRGNNGGDGSYLIFLANPAHAPTPTTTLWSRHTPDAGRVKCNNNVNMQYVADQAACQQLAIANGHPFYSFRHNGQNQGHKCMSSATCDSPLLNRRNEWYVYAEVEAPEWTMGVALTGSGGTVATDIGQAEFNRLFNACPVVKYTRNGGVHSVYTRRAGRAEIDAFSIFTYRWASSNNQLGTDFDIYSSEADARSGSGAWTFCNYDDPDVGYPRDCGPNGNVNNQWFTMPSSGQHDSNSGGGAQRFDIRNINSGASFEIYTGADCPADHSYHYGTPSGNTCPTSDVSEADCLAAVQHLLPMGQAQGRTQLVAGSWGWVPPGCSVQSHFTHGQNGDWAAHYNRNSGGQNDGGYTPVCVASTPSFMLARENTKCDGGSVRLFREEIPTLEQCYAQCATTADCHHFSWGPWGTQTLCMGCTTSPDPDIPQGSANGFTFYDMASFN